MPKFTLLCLALSLAGLLAGCGGMNRAVGVVPNAFDDLAAKRAAARGQSAVPPAAAPGPVPKGN